MSTGTLPTEYEFSPLSKAPPVTLVTRKQDKKDRGMLEQQAENQAKPVAEQH
jgi:hypothetical protein